MSGKQCSSHYWWHERKVSTCSKKVPTIVDTALVDRTEWRHTAVDYLKSYIRCVWTARVQKCVLLECLQEHDWQMQIKTVLASIVYSNEDLLYDLWTKTHHWKHICKSGLQPCSSSRLEINFAGQWVTRRKNEDIFQRVMYRHMVIK